MPETSAALLLAHVLADYAFQSDWIVANKRRPHVLALHGAIVFATAWIALGFAALPLVLAVTLLHVATDAAKTRLGKGGLRSYAADQGVHLAAIFVLPPLFAAGWEDGIWAGLLPAPAPALMALAAGLLFATRAGGIAVQLVIAPLLARDWSLRAQVNGGGLKGAGATIGQIERALAFVSVLTGTVAGLAILVAAKSVLRFSDAQKSRKLAEYVIIGTLASVGWAVMTGLATRMLILALQPEGLPGLLSP
ncbi:DUF3307 domain-containing protein [Mangrovicoccus algicola]|uniref:DUF3307 domain-containing protein n=1 Tax=Mangrovicoccus algicola TaxID=2771008 RepID=A0A8J7CVW8_9RHOB|nr:DUF3307 domain-containing protein [Mangrovicoccus algicola]MBE3636972.1 DUF3307 domain-containing protein [Mangrovicoccus algicola]